MSGLGLVVNVTLFPTKHPGFNLKPCACIGFCEKKKNKMKETFKGQPPCIKVLSLLRDPGPGRSTDSVVGPPGGLVQ